MTTTITRELWLLRHINGHYLASIQDGRARWTADPCLAWACFSPDVMRDRLASIAPALSVSEDVKLVPVMFSSPARIPFTWEVVNG